MNSLSEAATTIDIPDNWKRCGLRGNLQWVSQQKPETTRTVINTLNLFCLKTGVELLAFGIGEDVPEFILENKISPWSDEQISLFEILIGFLASAGIKPHFK